jgi:hypothetical protein
MKVESGTNFVETPAAYILAATVRDGLAAKGRTTRAEVCKDLSMACRSAREQIDKPRALHEVACEQ